MPAPLVSLTEAKKALDLTVGDADRDLLLQIVLDGAAGLIAQHTGRNFTPDPAPALTSLSASAQAGDQQVTLATVTGLAAGSTILLDEGLARETAQVQSLPGGNVAMLAQQLTRAHASSAKAWIDTGSPSTRSFPLRGNTAAYLPDARQITSVALDGAALSADDYDLDGDPATLIDLLPRNGSYTRSGTSLAVTARWGLWPVPAEVRSACLTLASRAWRERDASYGDAVQLADGAAISYFRSLPASVLPVLDAYRVRRT